MRSTGTATSDRLGAGVTSSSYEIRITGILPPEALLDFENLIASVEPVATVVHGRLPDQAALHGLLARLEMLGVQVLEVRRLHEQALPDSLDHQFRSAPGPDERDTETPSGG
jgi:hypothetical protein